MSSLANSAWILMGVWMVASSVYASEPEVGPCSLPITVRATLLADGNPEWSTAMIYHRDRKTSQSYTINANANQIRPGVFVREIHKLAVILENQGKLERCVGEAHQFTGESTTPESAKDALSQPALREFPQRLRDIFKALGDAQKAGVSGVGGAAKPGVKAAKQSLTLCWWYGPHHLVRSLPAP